MLKYLIEGGIFMWVILLASISGLAVIIEKMYTFLSKEKKLSENEKNQLYKALRTGNREEILKLCKDKTDSISKSVTKIVSNMDINFDELDNSHRQVIEGIISESILEQTTELEKGMSLLGTVVNAAPQLGLLGTVTGMIAAFSALTRNGTSTAKIVAGGISEALYTTAFGLIVAIPALVFYNYFNRRIDVIVAEMERAALQFLSRVKD
ncbi:MULTISPECIES: MotA/TolQ/ExbB proton channel family protein [unclassified Leptotrichia]|jgi:motA/tolQ/exbB proton channel family protein|uniref:MotA/TolQ/ExbB proton channel family protein n=1 Tax=unclassified Leptotrichia TaxID=2633022 RepID=UPI0003AD9A8B|nr:MULTISPECIES: MotA/TolQ/ExbB proton channel family protein [unclassified Leptotrichia]ERL25678.1 transporter, MotA/TolQ/ExbB proton channel family protein [Leptotrichia sp. oral taxon 225 str. F0581]WLD73894.1 MotA/TolQ/ExbB proton channel family protein [Leptotrichia sp. HMT-225]